MTVVHKAPERFVPAGDVTWAAFIPGSPSFISSKKVSGTRAQGVRYEKRAQAYLKRMIDLTGTAGESLLQSPWLAFKANGSLRERYCQPDAVLVDTSNKHITIFEVKLQHTSAAWWQVRQLYEPVLRVIYPGFSFSAIEIVKWLEPKTTFPETFFYAENIFARDGSKFGVHIYDPRINR